MALKDIRNRRNELQKIGINLSNLQFSTDDYELGTYIKREQTKVYNRWKFFDGFLKAVEKLEKHEKENKKRGNNG